MILVVDHHDSFTHNLVQLIEVLGHRTLVVPSDARSAADLVALGPDAVVLSPGPGGPERAGVFPELLDLLDPAVPVLGVCLGHQTLGLVAGGRIVRAEPVHGRTSLVHHRGEGILAGTPSPFPAARYHSLAIDPSSVPDDVRVTGWTEDGVIMALQHERLPRHGVQFHPESILTPDGPRIVGAFLALAGRPTGARRA